MSKNKKIELSQEQKDLQKQKGLYYRKLMTEATRDFLSHVKDLNKVGIFLSGGVDSTTVLWALLEQGVRPYCYTFNFPTNANLPTDAVKAKALADKYELPFRVVEMPTDPDEIAELIYKINDESDSGLASRPDFEVLPVFYKMTEHARNLDGVTDIFSGIGDSVIHLLGRTNEIEGRTGKMTPLYTDMRRIESAPAPQLIQIIKMMSRIGTRLHLPLTTTAGMDPYSGVPWTVMNHPRLKQITIGAWETEETLSGIKAVVSPLQNGDTNGRGYYDSLIPKSNFVINYLGRDINTAQVFYNSLMRSRNVPLRDDDKMLIEWEKAWVREIADGVPMTDEENALGETLKAKGILIDPDRQVKTSEEPLFGDLFDDPEPEGEELPIPPGVYSVPNEEDYEQVYQFMETLYIELAEYIKECSDASASGPREVFAKWHEKSENNFKKLGKIRSK